MEQIDILYFLAPWNLIFGLVIGICTQILTRMIIEISNNPEWILSVDSIWNVDLLKIILFGTGFWLIVIAIHTIQYILFGKRKA